MAGYIGTQPFTEASYDKQIRIATEGQTTFNVEYSPKFLDVLVNGVELVDADYVAVNGSTVVLNEALEESDEVIFKTWGTFNIADTYTQAEIDAKDALQVSRADILGTVSQTGGVPTGAIIERGSNGYGEYVKYADGTLICYKKLDFTDTLNPNGQAKVLDIQLPATIVNQPAYSFSGVLYDSTTPGWHNIGYFTTYTDGRAMFATTGHRPQDVNPQWDSVGAYSAAGGWYSVTAIGRWF